MKGECNNCEKCLLPVKFEEAEETVYERKGVTDPERLELVHLYPVLTQSKLSNEFIVRITDITEKKK